MGRISRLIVAGCVVASLLGACSSSGKVTGNKVLSKSDYISHADAICRSYAAKIDSVFSAAAAGPTLTVEQLKQVFNEKQIPLFRGELADLRTLRPPRADRARISAMLVNLSQAINTIVGEVGGATSVAELNAIHPSGLARFKLATKDYGMKAC
jgi:hypothetical protein